MSSVPDAATLETVLDVAARAPSLRNLQPWRWQVDGEEDLPAVHALQDALTLSAVTADARTPEGVPPVAEAPTEALTFFERMRVWSQAFPPAEHDRETLATYAELGLTGEVPVADQPEEVRAALETGYAVGKEALEASLRTSIPVVDGWQVTRLHRGLRRGEINRPAQGISGAVGLDTLRIADPRRRSAAASPGLQQPHAGRQLDSRGHPTVGEVGDQYRGAVGVIAGRPIEPRLLTSDKRHQPP